MVERLLEVMETYYTYTVIEADVTPEMIADTVKNDPEQVIEMLLDVIDDLED